MLIFIFIEFILEILIYAVFQRKEVHVDFKNTCNYINDTLKYPKFP